MAINKLNKTFTSEQVLTAEEMNQITNKIDEVIEPINNPAPPAGGYNRALFEAAGAVFNEESGYYELNGLTDITEEEMSTIYSETNDWNNGKSITGLKARTLLKPITRGSYTLSVNSNFLSYSSNIEVVVDTNRNNILDKINVKPEPFDNLGDFLYDCKKLRIFKPIVLIPLVKNFPKNILNWDALEEIYLEGMNYSVYLKAPNLKLECFQYLINTAFNTTEPKSVTVHPSVYAKITDEINEDWNALIAKALEKNITFVSA